MFGRRSDGKPVKNLPPEFKLIPSIMKERSDAQVFFKQDIVITAMDEYINQKAEEGIKFSYMDIIFAAAVRIISERPQLNRFVINGRVFQRNEILTSISIKKSLSDEGEETSIKIHFKGTGGIFEVKKILDEEIEKNKNSDNENSTDKMADFIAKVPVSFVKFAVGSLKFLDRHGMLPKSVIEASPFHTSVYITNVGSIGIDSIYHHLYNFGTTSMFLAMGKKKKSYVYEDDDIKQEKCITIGFVGDERICDGYYFASSFRSLVKYLNKPELLESIPEEKEEVTKK